MISIKIDINKNASKECKMCYYWYFKDIAFKNEPYLCNGCHGLMEKASSFNDVAIVYVKEVLTELTFGTWAKMIQ